MTATITEPSVKTLNEDLAMIDEMHDDGRYHVKNNSVSVDAISDAALNKPGRTHKSDYVTIELVPDNIAGKMIEKKTMTFVKKYKMQLVGKFNVLHLLII